MASSSKSINMPLMFAISVGASVSLVAITMFGLAWYEYESRVVLNEQVLSKPTHDDVYNKALEEQNQNLGDIEKAMADVAKQNSADAHGAHHGGGE